MAESVHLLARQHEAHRTLQRAGGEHRQHGLILRPQSRPERAADERRDHAQIVRLQVEDGAEIALHVLHALGLVVDRELAVAVPHHRRRVQFHRIVMLGRDEVFRLVAHRGRRIGSVGIAARLFRLRHDEGLVALRLQVGDEVRFFVFDAQERSGEARDFPLLGEDQGDRLSAELDLVVVQRAERRAFLRRHIVLIRGVRARHRRPIFVRQNVEDALDA